MGLRSIQVGEALESSLFVCPMISMSKRYGAGISEICGSEWLDCVQP
jgi:hypothetical protein